MLDGATCLPTTNYSTNFPCMNLIDPTLLFRMTHTSGLETDPAFAYQMQSSHTVRTIFFGNREDCWCLDRIKTSQFTVGTNTDPTLNSSCSDVVTDGGWYECPSLVGDVISIQRTTGSHDYQNIMTLRAYEGINVAKDATIFTEPSSHTGSEGADNLL